MSILIPGEDGGGLTADVDASFSFDDTCMLSSCQLTVVLTYNSVDGSLTKAGQVLTGVIFEGIYDPASTSEFVFAGGGGSTLVGGGSGALTGGSSFVGQDAATASGELGTDISPHWAVNANLSFGVTNGLGSILITSVGDITFGGNTATGAGSMHLLAGSPSSVELNPPNGVDFGIVPTGVCDATSCPNPLGNDPNDSKRALISDSATFILNYDGSVAKLTGIEEAHFLFGTDGSVPAPGASGLLVLGLGALGWRFRRP